MNELSVAEKKKVIRKLSEAYLQTTISHQSARRIEAAIASRLDECENSPFMPMWAWASVAVAVTVFAVTMVYMTLHRSDALPEKAFAVFIKGDTTVANAGKPKSKIRLNEGARTEVYEGEILQTETGGALGIVFGKHRIEMAERTELKLERLSVEALQFRVRNGKARFSIAKLGGRETFQVHAGDVVVHVVGTQFSVENHNDCIRVAVSEGKVRTVFQNNVQFVSAGEENAYCQSPSAKMLNTLLQPSQQPMPHEAGRRDNINGKDNNRAAVPVESSELARRSAKEDLSEEKNSKLSQSAAIDTRMENEAPSPAIERAVTANSDELLLFDNAHKALTRGGLSTAASLFEKYLTQYPGGEFAEDASFRLVRIAFRQNDNTRVMRWSEKFLQKYGGSQNHRTLEVQILKARMRIRQGEYRVAVKQLSSLALSTGVQTNRHQHQIGALLMTAACDGHLEPDCHQWANGYLHNWPNGPFAEKAKKIAVQVTPEK